MIGLAGLLRHQGRFDEALLLAQVSHSSRITVLSADHLRTLNSAHSLSVLFRLIGASTRAILLETHVIDCRTTSLGADHKDTLSSKLTLALSIGDVETAAALKERGVKE